MALHLFPRVQTRQTFSGSDVSLHDPAILRAPLDDLNGAAMALAHACGESWLSMTPLLMERYRKAILFAAHLIDPQHRQLLSYVMESTKDPQMFADRGEFERRQLVRSQSLVPLNVAIDAASGNSVEAYDIARMQQAWDEMARKQRGEAF